MDIKKTVLIIDDESDFVETMRFHFENGGYRVITAADGEEGLKKAQSLPDLILLDLNMPGLTGHQVCRILKENLLTAAIPVIMLTAQSQTIDKVHALNLGAADYICKTAEIEEIHARVKAALRNAPAVDRIGSEKEKNRKLVELRTIIDKNDIRIFYQPIIDLATRRVLAFEALTRGPRGHEFESPLKLFNAAAEVNMFFELDNACRKLAVERATFLDRSRYLFLNTDPSIIDNDEFKQFDFLKGSSLSPQQVCLELTERTAVKNFEKFSLALNFLKSTGFRIAIDDAGEGYSSLKAIAELKPDYIKADMSMVRDVDTNPTKRNVIGFMVDLTKRLNNHLIAEGIETESECRTLVELGVEFGQGYYFLPPTDDVAKLTALMKV